MKQMMFTPCLIGKNFIKKCGQRVGSGAQETVRVEYRGTREGRKVSKALQPVDTGTSRPRAGTEGAGREDVICRVTEPGPKQTLRGRSLCGVRARQETLHAGRTGTEGSFSLECLQRHHRHFSSGVLQTEESAVPRPSQQAAFPLPLRASCYSSEVRKRKVLRSP